MSCLSWNCRGIGSPRTVRVLKDLVSNHKSNFIFSIETLALENKVEELRVKLGFDHCFSVDRIGRSGGLAIFWKNNFSREILSYSRNHIDVAVMVNNIQDWRLTCFYGYPERDRRAESWQLIRRLASLSSIPWCILGDFNDILFASDKKGHVPHPQHLFNGFQSTIKDCQLLELDLSVEIYTWEISRGTDGWVRERLDGEFGSHS